MNNPIMSGRGALEKPALTLGLMPLVDAAPLVVAQAGGYFAREGLAIELSVERSWASIRDKLATGVLDGAQMLAPMPLASGLGLDPLLEPTIALAALNQGGASLCVSTPLFKRLQVQGNASGPLDRAQALKAVIEADRGSAPPLTLAHVFPHSIHHYELRWWLASAGLRPDQDLNLVVVPPPLMLEQLRSGRIDGFYCGSPWPQLARQHDDGRLLFGKQALWNGGPDKVFGVTARWAAAHPLTVQALLRALIAAAVWLDDPRHHAQAADWMIAAGALNVDQALIVAALADIRFHSGAAGFPWRSQALWLLDQMRRWQPFDTATQLHEVAERSYRPDLYRLAAHSLGLATPLADYRIEGAHAESYVCASDQGQLSLPADRFFAGKAFDPAALRR
ncbi:MAG TPA: CmpA/NrtA family ABC transporter substrate-binding protein [Fontimonas sp.]